MTETNWKELKVEKLEFEYIGTYADTYPDWGDEAKRCWKHDYKVLINGIDTKFTVQHEHWAVYNDDYELHCDEPYYFNDGICFTDAHREAGVFLGIPESEFVKRKYAKSFGFPKITNIDLVKKKVKSGYLILYRIELSDGQVLNDRELKDDVCPQWAAKRFVEWLLNMEGKDFGDKMYDLDMGNTL